MIKKDCLIIIIIFLLPKLLIFYKALYRKSIIFRLFFFIIRGHTSKSGNFGNLKIIPTPQLLFFGLEVLSEVLEVTIANVICR